LAAVAVWRPRAFLSLAAVEIVVMAATAGLAVGLSRTAPPDGGEHAVAVTSTSSAGRDLRPGDLITL
jgi:putative copper resistance protein D